MPLLTYPFARLEITHKLPSSLVFCVQVYICIQNSDSNLTDKTALWHLPSSMYHYFYHYVFIVIQGLSCIITSLSAPHDSNPV